MTGTDAHAYQMGEAAARGNRADLATQAEAIRDSDRATESDRNYAARFLAGFEAQRRADSPLTRHLTPRTAHV